MKLVGRTLRVFNARWAQGVRTSRARCFVHHAHVFTFVHEEAVAPTNNVAERALRTAVQWRKIMFGNRRAEGIVRLTALPAIDPGTMTGMNTRRPRYHRHRFPPEIISHAVWLYHRYCMSFRDVEDLLAERGIIVSYETVRQWCGKFGPDYARQLKRRQGRLGDTWFLDEVFVTINGQRQYLWRAVDQDGDLIDILVQPRRDGRAARRFFRRLLKSQRQEPVRLVTDKLGSYRVAHRDLMPLVTHDTRRYANNRAEVSHQPTRQRERQMRGFTSSDHAQRFLHVHGVIQNLFRVGRHLLRAAHHRMLRARSFTVWAQVTAA